MLGFFFLRLIDLFYFLAVVGLHCCTWAFSSCSARLLIVVSSLLVEHGLQGRQASGVAVWVLGSYCSRALEPGLVVVAHGLSCSVACGIFPDQGAHPCLLCWQVGSLPLSHQAGPATRVICFLD